MLIIQRLFQETNGINCMQNSEGLKRFSSAFSKAPLMYFSGLFMNAFIHYQGLWRLFTLRFKQVPMTRKFLSQNTEGSPFVKRFIFISNS